MSTTGRASVAVAASAAATASYDPLPPDVDRRTRTARTALNETFGPREFQEGPFKALDEARKGAVQIPTENVTFLLQQFHIAQHGHPIYPLSPEFARACVRARSNAKVYESFLHETKRKLPYKMSLLLGCCEAFGVRLSGNEKVDDLVAKLQEDRLGGRWSNHRYDPAVRYTNYYHEKAYPPPEILFTAAGINYDIADPNYPRGDQATPGKILGGLNHRLSPNLANFNGELVAGRAPLNIYALARSGKLGNRIGWIARINGLPVHKRRPQDAKSVGVQLTPGGQRRLPVHPIVALLAWQPSLLDYLANQSTKSGRPVLRDLQCVYEIALQKSAHEMDREMMIAGLKTEMAKFKR
ncbi:hypothetical protein GQ42DRAFT_179406 [Ramicandelaber brevisporus]|nr:hypothetical protein GQ42DRAFT_179406 [Ramicandelaber brevisporus]